MLELKRYQEEDKVDWDGFIKIAKNGCFLFYRNYMDYHKHRFTDHSLIIYKKGKILGVLPATEHAYEITSHGGLTFGGLVMHFDLKATEVIDIFQMVIDYYADLKISTIIYKSIPSIFHSYPAEEDLYALFNFKAELFRRDISSVIPLNNLIRFSESKRQSVTKCQKNHVQVVESIDFTEYWDLLTSVLEKFNTTPVHSLTEIEYLRGLFPDNIRLFEARMNGELLAGIVIYEYEQVVHTQYMANSNAGRTIGALDFINYELINNIYKDRVYYHFGISTSNMGKELNAGLIQQKEMMGARAIAIDFYKINLDTA